MSQAESPQIKVLKQRYKASFVDKIKLLNQQLDLVADSKHSSQQLAELHQVLHKLAGSSGMYGYLNINLLCRQIIDQIDAASTDHIVAEINKLTLLLEQHG